MAFVRIRGDVDFREIDIETMDELRPRMVAAVSRATEVAFNAVRDALSRSETSPDAPALRTGELRDSVRMAKPSGRAKYRQRGTVTTRHFWATVHEFGGRVGVRKLTRIPARPVWRSTFERIEPEVDRILRDL